MHAIKIVIPLTMEASFMSTYSVCRILCYNVNISIHIMIALKLLQLKEVIMKRWGKEVPLSLFYRQRTERE